MSGYSGAGAWHLLPFVGGVKAQDEADGNVASSKKAEEKAVAAQADADSALADALSKREAAEQKQERRKAEQSSQLILESGMRKYEKETRGRLFGYDYTQTLDALGNEEIQLAQEQIDTITNAVTDEQRDNIPEVKFPIKLMAGLALAGVGVFIIQKKRSK